MKTPIQFQIELQLLRLFVIALLCFLPEFYCQLHNQLVKILQLKVLSQL